MSRQWVLSGQQGFETSLQYQEDVKIPLPNELGSNEVLVKIHAASLNHRELMMADSESINGPIRPSVVPACDGAGVVIAVGQSVKEFQPFDRVVTHLAPKLVEASGDDAFSSFPDVLSMLGQGTDGTLRSVGVFPAGALVHAPKSLDWLPAATLTCTWTTAWNSLFGVEGRKAGPGTWVLVQGTGGVSIATLQLAAAAGASVVATTSTGEKEVRLKALGATHTVNYRLNPDNWGQEARNLTPGGRGFDIVSDVGGNQTLSQSLVAVRSDGIVTVVGNLGDSTAPVPLFAVLLHTCIVRGLLGGSRAQYKQLVRYIDEKGIQPAIDDVVFELTEAKDAYRRQKEKKHFCKVVIRVDH